MNIWNVPSPANEPSLTLTHWRVLQCTNGKRYLNGWCVERMEGRCSTAILGFDLEQMIASTISGRRYKLSGVPGIHPDAAYTWDGYSRVNQLVVEAEVSTEYVPVDRVHLAIQRVKNSTDTPL